MEWLLAAVLVAYVVIMIVLLCQVRHHEKRISRLLDQTEDMAKEVIAYVYEQRKTT